MNERIKELALQAGWDLWEGRAQADMTGCETELQKFAELIVQDCLSQIAMIGVSNFEDDDSGDISWTVGKCIEMIKYRFEIKE